MAISEPGEGDALGCDKLRFAVRLQKFYNVEQSLYTAPYNDTAVGFSGALQLGFLFEFEFKQLFGLNGLDFKVLNSTIIQIARFELGQHYKRFAFGKLHLCFKLKLATPIFDRTLKKTGPAKGNCDDAQFQAGLVVPNWYCKRTTLKF